MAYTLGPSPQSCPHRDVTIPISAQAPSGNFSWVQYGLGQPMVVQGLRVTAPSGGCCAGESCR